MIGEVEMVFRLVAASLLGGAVGYQRDIYNKPAGLRTNMLVCLGSALVMIYSENAFGGQDMSARVAAGVITGVGFLGAGTIIHSKKRITGLTTAASMWIVASIGMAVGGGQDMAAITATILVVMILYFSNIAEGVRRTGGIIKKSPRHLAEGVRRTGRIIKKKTQIRKPKTKK
ncbi:MAG: MgtC/SapB family protein [Candidatus Micrarchaeota archaeon]